MNKDQFFEMLKDLDSNELAWIYYNLTLPSKEYMEILLKQVHWRMNVENVMVAMEFKNYIANYTYIKELNVKVMKSIADELHEKVKPEFMSIDWSQETISTQVPLDSFLLLRLDHTVFSLYKFMAQELVKKGAVIVADNKR